MTTVVNKRKEDYDTYIGRGSVFGNPFKIGVDGDRDEVIEKFRTYFYKRIEEDEGFKYTVLQLKDRRLGCFCKPKKCHGDVIVEYLEKGETNE
jgi:hypothetical protein